MSSLLPIFYVLLLLIPFHTEASQEKWAAEWWPEQEQQSYREHLVPLQTYNDHVVPHFIRYLIPGMTRRSSDADENGNQVRLPNPPRARYSPDFGYQTRYSVAEDAAQDSILRLQLLTPHGAGRRRRDTLSLPRFLGKRVLSLSKQH